MTKPLIELPSVQMKRLRAENDALHTDIDALHTDNNALSADLAAKNALPADKDAELARMRELLEQYHNSSHIIAVLFTVESG